MRKKSKNTIQYIISDGILTPYLKDHTFSDQRLRPLGHADSQRNTGKSTCGVIILNMLKEKSLFRQSREKVFWQLLIVSC